MTTDRSLTPLSVTAVRIGRTNLGDGRIVLDEETISVVIRSSVDEHPVRMGFESVESVAVEGDELVLALRDGTRVTLVAAAADRVAAAVLARCRALPELTRTLRTFGSRRGTQSRRESSPVEQRRFFAPLLDARRLAGAATVPAAVITAFDDTALAAAIAGALRAFAAERHAEEGPARRALEAELDEIAEPLMLAIAALADTATEARSAVDDLRLWRSWAAQLQAMFEVADRVWISLDAALDAAPLRQ